MEELKDNIVYVVVEKGDMFIQFKPGETNNIHIIGVYQNKFEAEKACSGGNRIMIGPVPFYRNEFTFPKPIKKVDSFIEHISSGGYGCDLPKPDWIENIDEREYGKLKPSKKTDSIFDPKPPNLPKDFYL